jgi:hypothetical protein
MRDVVCHLFFSKVLEGLAQTARHLVKFNANGVERKAIKTGAPVKFSSDFPDLHFLSLHDILSSKT